MKFLVILLCFVYTVSASLEEDTKNFANFRAKHGKLYKNYQEEKIRFSIFQQNLREIEEHNRQFQAGNTTYTKGVNQFTDLTKEEFVALLNRRSADRPKPNTVYEKNISVEIPDSLDWRQSGVVSKVKDQGSKCGCCWAFSATGVLESYYYMKYGEMVLFSEQQLVDCDSSETGCDGGDEGDALGYIKENGIVTEDDYPYEAVDDTCRYNQNNKVDLQIQEVVNLQSKNEDDLLQAVGSIGPVTVAIDATQLDSYSSGVYTRSDCSKDDLDHAVLAVGYGHDDATGLDYWIIKNSWGENWGESGYFRIKRGSNECGVATENHYPVLA